MDLLLLYSDVHHHYVLFAHLVKVVCFVRLISFVFVIGSVEIDFGYVENYNAHITKCGNNAPAVIHMPASDQHSYKFTNLSETWFVLLVMYFDFGSFVRPMSGCRRPSSRAFTQVNEIHKQCGFALTVIDQHCSKPIFYQVDSSEDCMANFAKVLQKHTRDNHKQKRIYPFSKATGEVWQISSYTMLDLWENVFGSRRSRKLDWLRPLAIFSGGRRKSATEQGETSILYIS